MYYDIGFPSRTKCYRDVHITLVPQTRTFSGCRVTGARGYLVYFTSKLGVDLHQFCLFVHSACKLCFSLNSTAVAKFSQSVIRFLDSWRRKKNVSESKPTATFIYLKSAEECGMKLIEFTPWRRFTGYTSRVTGRKTTSLTESVAWNPKVKQPDSIESTSSRLPAGRAINFYY